VGTFGEIASFSFYPGKNLGAMGDAGAVVTNDQSLAEKMAMFARHGGLRKGDHKIEGINSRLDGIQAAILSVKLPHLHKWTAQRQERAARYTERLSSLSGIKIPKIAEGREHVWHLYVIKSSERNGLADYLNKSGVQTVINYPVALPFLPAYSRLSHKPAHFPNAFKNQSEVLSLPIFPELSDEQMDVVTGLISQYFRKSTV
jgi:dTDP-4-amino-4,6-dideoxygalactose transaminase